MNRKLLSVISMIVVLASFSAIGCKNNNTNPSNEPYTQKDIKEYTGNWDWKVETQNDKGEFVESAVQTISINADGSINLDEETVLTNPKLVSGVYELDLPDAALNMIKQQIIDQINKDTSKTEEEKLETIEIINNATANFTIEFFSDTTAYISFGLIIGPNKIIMQRGNLTKK